ncbi:MAG: hypothetical protein ACLFQ5_12305 [Oceanicaulis sp.]
MIAIVAMLGAGLVWFQSATRAPERDLATLCRLDQPLPAGHTIILVDKTDPLPADAASRLEVLIDQVRETLKVDDKLTLLEVDASNGFEPIVHFSLCKPPETGNDLYQNSRRIAEAFAAGFGDPLQAVQGEITAGGGEDFSPIFDAVSAAALRPDFSELVARRRLIVVSDMLENTTRYSVFAANRPQAAAFRSAPAYRPARLWGVQVDVMLVERREPPYARRQTEELRTFWLDLFTEAGAATAYRSL